MSKGRNTTLLSVRLPDELYNGIVARAKLRNQSISDWVRFSLSYSCGMKSVETLSPIIEDNGTSSDKEVLILSLPSGSKPSKNQPCPCGAKWLDGKPKKFKHCHGSALQK